MIGCDSETFPIKPGLLAPETVCWSWAERDHGTPVTTLRTAADGLRRLREVLGLRNARLVIHNAPFDLGCAAASDSSMLPLIFDAYADGRIWCTISAQKVIDVALGMRKFRRVRRSDGSLWVTKAGYTLAELVKLYTGRHLEKVDTWRVRYGLLAEIPIEQWPEDARAYAIGDAVEHLVVHDAQQLEITESLGGDCPNIPETCQAAWALHLMAMWGVRADPHRVQQFIENCQEQIAKMQAYLVCETCNGAQTIGGPVKKGGRPCPECGGTGSGTGLLREDGKRDEAIFKPDGSKTMRVLQDRVRSSLERLQIAVPLTDKKQEPQTSKDVLELTDDLALHALAETMGYEKQLGQWGPVVQAAVQRPVCARYNELVETGRTSCVSEGTLVEVVRDVSKHPRGVPIEDVQIGDLVYTYDADRNLCLRRVTAVTKTGHREVVRVHWLGTGRKKRGFVDVTPDHLVRLTSGDYVRADQLKWQDSVLALSRGISAGYARLWAYGIGEIRREHRFIYEQVHGVVAEHVHHLNENKLDNRVDNLEGQTASEHTSQHSRNPSPSLRTKRAVNMRQRWERGEVIVRSGEENPAWRKLTKRRARQLLVENRWSIYKAAKQDGWSDTTFNKKLRELGFDLNDLKRRADVARLDERRDWARRAREKKALKATNHKVIMVERLGIMRDVYDLTIEETHNFIAGEICVHNCGGGEGQEGTNFQNPPRKGDVRPCFVPRPSWLYVSTDADTIELRAHAQNLLEIVGWSNMADALLDQHANKGPDLHLRFAATLLSLDPYEALARFEDGDKELDDARQFAKVPNFGFPGGLGAKTLVAYAAGMLDRRQHLRWFGTNPIDQIKKARRYRDVWFESWPENKPYFSHCAGLIEDGGRGKMRQQMSGRIRDDATFTAICNGYFQGRVADAMKEALFNLADECYTGRCPGCDGSGAVESGTRLYDACAICHGAGRSPLWGSRPVMFLHDEPIVEHPDDHTLTARAERQRDVVVAALTRWMPSIPCTSTAVAMRRWIKGAKPVYVDGRLVASKPLKIRTGVLDEDGKEIVKTKWVADVGGEEQAAA